MAPDVDQKGFACPGAAEERLVMSMLPRWLSASPSYRKQMNWAESGVPATVAFPSLLLGKGRSEKTLADV